MSEKPTPSGFVAVIPVENIVNEDTGALIFIKDKGYPILHTMIRGAQVIPDHKEPVVIDQKTYLVEAEEGVKVFVPHRSTLFTNKRSMPEPVQEPATAETVAVQEGDPLPF